MPTLTLHYYSHSVGLALIDEPLAEAPPLKWSLDLPKRSRKLYGQRPDIIAAMLVEDTSLLNLCHPFTQTHGLVLRLSHLALRPQSSRLLWELVQGRRARGHVASELRALTSSVGRCVFANGNRCDCRLSNLRELVVAPTPSPEDVPLAEFPNPGPMAPLGG